MTFIKQEALEKAREIRVKADEEFAIEKAKLVKQETSAIDAQVRGCLVAFCLDADAFPGFQYDKKRKQAEVALKIAQSTQTNKSRLKLLQAREGHLQVRPLLVRLLPACYSFLPTPFPSRLANELYLSRTCLAPRALSS